MNYSQGINLCTFAKQAQNKKQSLTLYDNGIKSLLDTHKKDTNVWSKSRAREIIFEQLYERICLKRQFKII